MSFDTFMDIAFPILAAINAGALLVFAARRRGR